LLHTQIFAGKDIILLQDSIVLVLNAIIELQIIEFGKQLTEAQLR